MKSDYWTVITSDTKTRQLNCHLFIFLAVNQLLSVILSAFLAPPLHYIFFPPFIPSSIFTSLHLLPSPFLLLTPPPPLNRLHLFPGSALTSLISLLRSEHFHKPPSPSVCVCVCSWVTQMLHCRALLHGLCSCRKQETWRRNQGSRKQDAGSSSSRCVLGEFGMGVGDGRESPSMSSIDWIRSKYQAQLTVSSNWPTFIKPFVMLGLTEVRC